MIVLTQQNQIIIISKLAREQLAQYVDCLLSTVNPNLPDEDMWIRPETHSCQRSHSDIPEHEKQLDHVDLLNIVQ